MLKMMMTAAMVIAGTVAMAPVANAEACGGCGPLGTAQAAGFWGLDAGGHYRAGPVAQRYRYASLAVAIQKKNALSRQGYYTQVITHRNPKTGLLTREVVARSKVYQASPAGGQLTWVTGVGVPGGGEWQMK